MSIDEHEIAAIGQGWSGPFFTDDFKIFFEWWNGSVRYADDWKELCEKEGIKS